MKPSTPRIPLTIYSPAGVVPTAAPVRLAVKRLTAHGFEVHVDEAALAKRQRFAGDDEMRLEAIHRIAREAPSVAMATRGGYGLTRLLGRIDWKLLARSVERGTRWVGYSDLTVLQLGLLAKGPHVTWAGPMACDDFGRPDDRGGVDDVTEACFVEAMHGELEAVGFRCGEGYDGLGVKGTLWGGNLCMLTSLVGTRWMPQVKGGILFLEDVNEHPYRVERMLLQLLECGVIGAQKAVVLGQFDAWRPSPLDRGYTLRTALSYVRSVSKTPILAGLPFGHVPTKVTLPVGKRAELVVQGRDALLAWGH